MSTKDNLEREASSANSKLNEASDTIRSGARQAAEEAQRTASAYADQGKTAAASALTDFASAVRRASDELGQRDQGLAARLVSQAASSLEDAASSVSGASLDDVMGSVQGFARRNPTAFVVGSVLAGIALGRFAKATAEREDHASLPSRTGTMGASTPGATGGSMGTSRSPTGPASGTGASRPSTTMPSTGTGTSGSSTSGSGTTGSGTTPRSPVAPSNSTQK
ncbi:hypothetical protein [Acuticoccus sp.]|uniref:hypothetical protein n=1 Tax=Acuticoccus sp. TaxID=1904378 RepID=UPI003B52F94C